MLITLFLKKQFMEDKIIINNIKSLTAFFLNFESQLRGI